MSNFENYKSQLKQCISNGDTEIAHADADTILCDIACDMELTKEQREELVSLWEDVEKWYA